MLQRHSTRPKAPRYFFLQKVNLKYCCEVCLAQKGEVQVPFIMNYARGTTKVVKFFFSYLVSRYSNALQRANCVKAYSSFRRTDFFHGLSRYESSYFGRDFSTRGRRTRGESAVRRLCLSLSLSVSRSLTCYRFVFISLFYCLQRIVEEEKHHKISGNSRDVVTWVHEKGVREDYIVLFSVPLGVFN